MKLVDADLIVGAVVRPANEPEHADAGARSSPTVTAARAARRIADRSRLCGAVRAIGALHARGRGHSRQSVDQSPTAVAFPSRPSRSISPAARVIVPGGSRSRRFPTAPRPCTFPRRSVSPARSARRAPPRRARAARSRSIRRKRCCKGSALGLNSVDNHRGIHQPGVSTVPQTPITRNEVAVIRRDDSISWISMSVCSIGSRQGDGPASPPPHEAMASKRDASLKGSATVISVSVAC